MAVIVIIIIYRKVTLTDEETFPPINIEIENNVKISNAYYDINNNKNYLISETNDIYLLEDSRVKLYYNGHDAKKIKTFLNLYTLEMTTPLYNMAVLKTDGSVWYGTSIDELQQYNELNDIIDIEAMNNCFIALDKHGTMWIFGESEKNRDTPINDETEYYRPPEKIICDKNILKISCGKYHILALDENGDIWTFGIDNEEIQNMNQKVTSIPNIIEIKAGNAYSLALDKDGKIYSWGEVYNGSGLIGITEKSSEQTNVTQNINFASEPICINFNINLSSNAIKIDTIGLTSIAVDKENNLYFWGVLYKKRWPNGNYLYIPSEITVQKICQLSSNSKVFALSNGVLEVEESGTLKLWW